jgi:hypothetical protein
MGWLRRSITPVRGADRMTAHLANSSNIAVARRVVI